MTASGRAAAAGVPAPSTLAVAGILAVFGIVFSAVRPTNFGGWDEWLYVSLSAKGILGIPYAHRPLVLAWARLAPLLQPDSLWGFYAVYTACLAATGVLTHALVLRLQPGERPLAFVAGVLAAAWAPRDFLRLDTVLMTGYGGFTLGVVVALLLFVVAIQRRRATLLAVGLLAGGLTALAFEGVLPMLIGGAPVLVLLASPRSAWALRALLGWVVVLGAVAVYLLAPMLGNASASYQVAALGLDASPVGIGGRLLQQSGWHLLPLVDSPAELAGARPALAGLAFALVYALLARWRLRQAGEARVRPLLALAAAGVALAVLGWLPLLLTASTRGPARAQFLSAPGVALVMSACLVLVSRAAPVRLRPLVVGGLGVWLVVVAAGRTGSMQHDWDAASYWPAQSRSLAGLVRIAPAVKPGTLFVLLEGTGAWPANFSFRHAVDHLYGGEALGHARGAHPFLYDVRFTPDGVSYEPWAVLREPWREPARLYPYDALVLLRADAAGGVELVERWPAETLGPLPPGPAYAPRQRLQPGPPPARAAILRPW
jgi:hypothetical protein